MPIQPAIDDVAAFQFATGSPVYNTPHWPDDARIELRMDLIREEMGELERS